VYYGIYRTSLLGGTSAFADDPWSVIEERSGANAATSSDGHTMTIDQIRQQQQQIIAGLYSLEFAFSQSVVFNEFRWICCAALSSASF